MEGEELAVGGTPVGPFGQEHPSGSNHSSATRASRSERVHRPCSGCSANAAALSASRASASRGGTCAAATPRAPRRAAAPRTGCGASATARAPGRSPSRWRGPRVGRLAVRPQPQPPVADLPGERQQRLHQTPAVPLTTVRGVDDELGRGALHGVRGVEVGVADHARARRPALPHQQVAAGLLAAAAQVQQHVLAEGSDAVGLGGPRHEGEDIRDVPRAEPVRRLDVRPHDRLGAHPFDPTRRGSPHQPTRSPLGPPPARPPPWPDPARGGTRRCGRSR